jgi:hypothetical protein
MTTPATPDPAAASGMSNDSTHHHTGDQMSTDYRAHPEPEDLTDEAILKTAAKELGYEFTDQWFLTGRNFPPLEADPLELLNFARAVIDADRARYARPAAEPVAQAELGGPTEQEVSEWINSLPLWHGATRDELTGIVLRAFARYGRPNVAPIVPPELIRALELAEAGLADIGDADREPGDDLAWVEARAARDLPRIRQALNLWRDQTAAGSYAGLRNALRQIITLCDGLATDEVSDEFLCRAPGEVKALLEKLNFARAATPAVPRPEGDWFTVAMVAQDMRSRGLADQACGDELLKLANSNRSQPARQGRPAVAPVAQPEAEELTDEELKRLAWNIHAEAKDDTTCGDVVVRVCRVAIAADRACYGRSAVAPVAASERPWERPGWCDAEGLCWWCPPEGPAYWSMVEPAMVYGGSLLPHWAIPLPTTTQEGQS